LKVKCYAVEQPRRLQAGNKKAAKVDCDRLLLAHSSNLIIYTFVLATGSREMAGGSVAEWLACWTQAQKGPGSNRSRDAVE